MAGRRGSRNDGVDEALTARWADELARAGRVEFGWDRSRLVRDASITLLFVVAGLALVVTGTAVLAGVLVVALFGAGAAHRARLVMSPRDAPLVVDTSGLRVRLPRRTEPVPWADLVGATRRDVRGGVLVDLHVTRARFEAAAAGSGRLGQRMARWPGVLEDPVLTVLPDVDVPADSFAAWIGEELTRRTG